MFGELGKLIETLITTLKGSTTALILLKKMAVTEILSDRSDQCYSGELRCYIDSLITRILAPLTFQPSTKTNF